MFCPLRAKERGRRVRRPVGQRSGGLPRLGVVCPARRPQGAVCGCALRDSSPLVDRAAAKSEGAVRIVDARRIPEIRPGKVAPSQQQVERGALVHGKRPGRCDRCPARCTRDGNDPERGGADGPGDAQSADAHRRARLLGREDAFRVARRASASSAASCWRRSSCSSSTEDRPPGEGPAIPMSACAAARRPSTRRTPSLSTVIRTSSPGRSPSRCRKSAGRTSRPRSSSRAVPLVRSMWE